MRNFKVWCKTEFEREKAIERMKQDGVYGASNCFIHSAPVGLIVRTRFDGKTMVEETKDVEDFMKNNKKEIPAKKYIDGEKAIIYREGLKVIAKDLVTGETAEAKCNPSDTFDFKFGSKVAIERLFGKKDGSIEIGDEVRIVKPGAIYSTYNKWKGLKGFEVSFVHGRTPDTIEREDVYRVENLCEHGCQKRTLALIRNIRTTQVFIIDSDGIEKF